MYIKFVVKIGNLWIEVIFVVVEYLDNLGYLGVSGRLCHSGGLEHSGDNGYKGDLEFLENSKKLVCWGYLGRLWKVISTEKVRRMGYIWTARNVYSKNRPLSSLLKPQTWVEKSQQAAACQLNSGTCSTLTTSSVPGQAGGLGLRRRLWGHRHGDLRPLLLLHQVLARHRRLLLLRLPPVIDTNPKLTFEKSKVTSCQKSKVDICQTLGPARQQLTLSSGNTSGIANRRIGGGNFVIWTSHNCAQFTA